ncbi:MAG: pentapeptide repeat-containing protein [Rhizonema sp. PD38]|nr:pentapeptide repeat-containing protein [Rhizonema sp. PD38]
MRRSYRASREGFEKAEKAFQLKGKTQEYLAGAASCTRQTVNKFFAKKPIEKRLFQAICNELDLEWGEIAELELEEEQSCRNSVMDTARENICEITKEDYSTTKVLTPPVSVVEKQNVNCNSEQLVITFTGDIENLQKDPNYVAGVLALMQAVSKDASLKIEKIELGSIKITFSGSPEGLKRLEELIKSGNLKEVEGMPVENVQLLTGVTIQEEQDKFRLVREIITQGGEGRNLCDVNLSGANLRGADLSNADLSCADLSGTDLRNVNLSRSDLNCADLSGADLTDAELSGTYLHDAIIDSATRISNKWRLVWEILNQAHESRNLRGVDLYNANLVGANLRKADLEGANLYNANLYNANLEGANLYNANLEGAILWRANLEGAILEGANLYNANLVRDIVRRYIRRRSIL